MKDFNIKLSGEGTKDEIRMALIELAIHICKSTEDSLTYEDSVIYAEISEV